MVSDLIPGQALRPIEVDDLIEWRDDDDDTPRMGIVRDIKFQQVRVSGGSDPCAEGSSGLGWSAWVRPPWRLVEHPDQVKPGHVQLAEPPEGAEWRLVGGDGVADELLYSVVEILRDQAFPAPTRQCITVHKVEFHADLWGRLMGFKRDYESRAPAPEINEITSGMWVRLVGDDCFIERLIDGVPVIWFKSAGRGWRCESYPIDDGKTLKRVDPPANAGELLGLLGVGDNQ